MPPCQHDARLGAAYLRADLPLSLGCTRQYALRSDQKDLEAFLNWIDEFCAFFIGTIDGRAATCTEVYDIARTLPIVSAPPEGKIKEQVRSTLQAFSMSLYKDQPIRNWPATVGRHYGINLPRNVARKAEPSASGRANINIILDLLEQVKDIEGDIAECGVYRGATIATVAYWCRQNENRQAHNRIRLIRRI